MPESQLFSCEFYEISKNPFYRTPLGDSFYIVVFIFILKNLYHSFETRLLLSLFLFNGKIR